MAAYPLSQTVGASQTKPSSRSAILSLLTSTLVQGLTIAALIVAPLLASQTMPEPVSTLSVPRFVPVVIEPPVQRGPDRTSASSPAGDRAYQPTLLSSALVPPPQVPDGIPEIDAGPPPGSPFGVEGGVPSWLGGVSVTEPEPEPTPEEDPQPLRIVGDVRPPRKIVHVNPEYPAVALAAKIGGTVRLQAIIDADGRVVDLVVVDSVALLDRAAMDAVRQWRYEPTHLNGRAVPVIMTVSVKFVVR